MSLWSDVDTGQVVRRFFVEARHRADGPAGRARCDRVHDQLARFLERMDVTEPLGREAMIMLELEREYDPAGAALRLFDPIELVQCLPTFLSADWLLPNRVDAGRQISLTVGLARACRKASGSTFCSCCRHHDVVQVAATVARAVLEQDRAGWRVPD
jgi:hypothetical protein